MLRIGAQRFLVRNIAVLVHLDMETVGGMRAVWEYFDGVRVEDFSNDGVVWESTQYRP